MASSGASAPFSDSFLRRSAPASGAAVAVEGSPAGGGSLLRDSAYSGGDSVAYAWPAGPEEEAGGLSAVGAFGGGGREGRRFGLGAFDPGRRGVKALAVVAVLVIVIAAFLAWRARPEVDSVEPPVFESAVSTDDSVDEVAAGGTGTAKAGTASGSAEVVVAVGGKVRNPGLVRLTAGARVADALNAAGGAEPGVDVALLNLARKVVDGELILVGVTPSPGVVPTGAAAPAVGGTSAPAAPVNLNTATLSDLDTLPGVGPVLAQRILDARDAQGGFKAVSDLRKVDGIGDARYEQLKDLVTV
ncbi:helix-hairpin-helix domain-containing protein [Actinoplanes sp. CA-054009]